MIKSLYKNFQHWCSTGSIYIISDTHFDDEDCEIMDTNWITPTEQIERINHKMYKSDTFICLGDVGDPKYIASIKAEYKVLIKGNHDTGSANYKEYFNEIFEGPLFISDKILLSHEPIILPFCINIHGHDHNGVEYYTDNCKHLNLAANVCNYTPINLGEEIKKGLVSGIPSIHRITINNAAERKNKEWRNKNE